MKKLICILLLLISMGTMYYFSSQDGETSTVQSNKVIEIIDEIRDRVTLKNEKLISIKNKIISELRGYNKSFLVRKGAHFGIYSIIGAMMMITIYLFSKRVIFSAGISLFLTFLYAVYDETRQLNIDGRAGSFKDVLIDSSGALLAITILSILLFIGKKFALVLKKR